MSDREIDDDIARFVDEAVKINGDFYPPNSLYLEVVPLLQQVVAI